MPSLLATMSLAALAGSGGHHRRRLVQDASLTPCTHDICGRRTLRLPTYHSESLVPGTNLKRCDDNTVAATCDNEATGFATDGYLMKLDISQAHRGSGGSGSIRRSGDSIVVSVTMGSGWDSYDQCHLGVNIVQDKLNSDATLQFNANKYVTDNVLTADYTGNTTLAVPAETTDITTQTMSVTVTPSSFPYRYEDSNGAKLHTGRMGITLSPYIRCDGAQANALQEVAVYLPDFHAQAKGTDGTTAHPFFYDLKADGTSLTSQDQAGNTAGLLKFSDTDAKRAYEYSAPFVHFHEQVRFPNASIAAKSHDDHFKNPADPANAKCSWNHGTFATSINYDGTAPTLRDNGWMTDKDSATPTQAYAAWVADECAAGVCKKYKKEATVGSTTAYLPFDKPLESYYTVEGKPKVQCISQDGSVVGIAEASEIVPDIANDDAPAIFSSVKTKFTQPVNIACAQSRDGSVNGVDTTICDTIQDTLLIKGQIFSFDAVTTDFTDLLTDEYDFSATYGCGEVQVTGTPAETCTITDGADTVKTKLTALERTKNGADLTAQLEAKANAVEALEFSVPAKYGTTFKTFEVTLSGYPTVTGGQKFRATGAFEVTMLLSDSDTSTTGSESIQWTGGPEAKASKDFEGFTTTDRFTARTPLIITQTRVKAAALTGYFTTDANFADNGNGTGIMSPFNDVGDLALSADTTEKANLEGAYDAFAPTDAEMGPGNQFYAVKSHCCGRDDTRSGVNCKDSRKNSLAADDAAASTYCRTNGFQAVRCLSSELDVSYTVTTLSKDDRFPSKTEVATKTYTQGATASLSQTDQGFSVTNTEYDAVTVGAGDRAGDTTFDYTVVTTHMGTAKTQFARQAYTTTTDVETYNCESGGRTIVYSVDVATPCGESELDTPTMTKYALTASVEAHYVYTNGSSGTPDQVSQKVATGTVPTYDKDNGAEAYNNPDNTDTDVDWLTTEWRVQDSSAPTSEAKGSGTPIELKVVIANNNAVTDYDSGLHMPASKVFIVDDATLKVSAGEGSVALKTDSCTTTAGGETSCVLLYTNNDVMSIADGKLCGDLGDDSAVGGANGNADQPACPVIEYTIAARVKNGGLTNAFGAAGACGVETGEVTLTKIGAVRSHTLYVMGNKRAYDGVLDIHAIEADAQCAAYCAAAQESANCYESSYTSSNADFLHPEVSGGSTYCRNPFRLATETLHDVAVPGKDGAARTILDPVTEGKVATSKDLTFEVRFLRIGYGPRRFTINGLTDNVPVSLPKPFICSSGEYGNTDGEGCVRSDRTQDLGNVDTVIADQKICPTQFGGSCTDAQLIDNIGKFYIALGKNKITDVCSNTNVDSDPYTVDVSGVSTMTLGFSIKVDYFTDEGAGTGSGDPDSGVEHKFYFQLACPQKDYSINFVYADGNANAQRANIAAGADMGLVNKDLYGESHYKYLKMSTYFSGRSTERYDSSDSNSKCETNEVNSNCHKAMVRMEDNPSVTFRVTGAQPVSTFDGGDAIFLDSADTFEERQEIEFEFKSTTTPCLFTTITLISKTSPFNPGTTTLITNNAEDKKFSFRVQCPRWRQATASDALVLHYDVKTTEFGGSGGSVTTVQQPLSTTGQVNAFDSITTSLKGNLCDNNSPATVCTFPTEAEGADSKLEKTGSQQEWLEYLKTCGFSETGGTYVGFMERLYSRPDLGLSSVGAAQEYQTYCSGRKLSFGIVTQGTHTARLRVESPLEMEFAVQVDKLEWSQVGCDSNLNEYKLLADATVYRKVSTSQVWAPAAQSTFTDITPKTGFIGTPTITEPAQTGTIQIEGACQALVADHSNCALFTAERELDFGALYSQFGVDYRANLGIDLEMTCPKGVKQGSGSGVVALRHDTECTDYNDPNKAFAAANCGSETTGGKAVAVVGANGQVRLTLVIDDTDFQDHTVDAPTYTITPTDGGAPTQGLVSSLCDVLQADCVYQAKDASGNDIDLVTSREYPSELVTIDGTAYNFSLRADEENSVVTLRALPLSGTTVEITWVVTRVLDTTRRMLRVTYSLGAAATNGADSVAFKVLPATREEDAGIAVGAETEEAVGGGFSTHNVSADDTQTTKVEEEKGDSGEVLLIVAIVLGSAVFVALVAMVFNKKANNKKAKSQGSGTGDSGSVPDFTNSRFYQYSRLEKQQERNSRFL